MQEKSNNKTRAGARHKRNGKALVVLTVKAIPVVLAVAAFGGTSLAAGLPGTMTVITGAATQSTSGNTQTVNITDGANRSDGSKLVRLGFDGMSVGAGNTVNFVNNTAAARVLTLAQDTSGQVTNIAGVVNATGGTHSIALLNPNGINVANGASINATGAIIVAAGDAQNFLGIPDMAPIALTGAPTVVKGALNPGVVDMRSNTPTPLVWFYTSNLAPVDAQGIATVSMPTVATKGQLDLLLPGTGWSDGANSIPGVATRTVGADAIIQGNGVTIMTASDNSTLGMERVAVINESSSATNILTHGLVSIKDSAFTGAGGLNVTVQNSVPVDTGGNPLPVFSGGEPGIDIAGTTIGGPVSLNLIAPGGTPFAPGGGVIKVADSTVSGGVTATGEVNATINVNNLTIDGAMPSTSSFSASAVAIDGLHGTGAGAKSVAVTGVAYGSNPHSQPGTSVSVKNADGLSKLDVSGNNDVTLANATVAGPVTVTANWGPLNVTNLTLAGSTPSNSTLTGKSVVVDGLHGTGAGAKSVSAQTSGMVAPGSSDLSLSNADGISSLSVGAHGNLTMTNVDADGITATANGNLTATNINAVKTRATFDGANWVDANGGQNKSLNFTAGGNATVNGIGAGGSGTSSTAGAGDIMVWSQTGNASASNINGGGKVYVVASAGDASLNGGSQLTIKNAAGTADLRGVSGENGTTVYSIAKSATTSNFVAAGSISNTGATSATMTDSFSATYASNSANSGPAVLNINGAPAGAPVGSVSNSSSADNATVNIGAGAGKVYTSVSNSGGGSQSTINLAATGGIVADTLSNSAYAGKAIFNGRANGAAVAESITNSGKTVELNGDVFANRSFDSRSQGDTLIGAGARVGTILSKADGGKTIVGVDSSKFITGRPNTTGAGVLVNRGTVGTAGATSLDGVSLLLAAPTTGSNSVRIPAVPESNPAPDNDPNVPHPGMDWVANTPPADQVWTPASGATVANELGNLAALETSAKVAPGSDAYHPGGFRPTPKEGVNYNVASPTDTPPAAQTYSLGQWVASGTTPPTQPQPQPEPQPQPQPQPEPQPQPQPLPVPQPEQRLSAPIVVNSTLTISDSVSVPTLNGNQMVLPSGESGKAASSITVSGASEPAKDSAKPEAREEELAH